MDATYLKDAAESYDFAKGFFQPTDTEIMGSAVQNFGILLSTLMQQRLLILNWDKFDPVSTDLKSYEIESHHYELKFLTETEASAGTIIRKRGFFIITHYDRHIKVKPSLIKRGQKPSSSRLNEIKPVEAEAQDSINMDDHFDGMLSEPEQEAKVKTSAKKFVSHVIEGFKTQFKPQTGTASPSTCGFVHGSLLPFQKEYDFFAEASQIPNIENPLNQYDIFLNKKFTSSYKRLTPDYPIIFYILDADKSMNQIDIQKNLLKVLLEHSRKRKIELPQKSLAQKALITYVNSNTEKETIRQIDMPTLYTKNFDLRKHLTELANALHQGGPENQKKAKEIEHSLKWELENPILSDNLIKKELCTKNSKCLSNYIHGMFSGDDKSAYIVKSDLETGEAEGRRTNFLLETDNRDLQVMLRVHEYDYTPEGNKLSLDDEINVPSLHEDSKVVAVINVVVPYSDETISEWETPDIEISSSVKKVNPNKEFQIEKIEQLNLVRETPFLSHADGTVSKSPDEAKKFLQHAGSQFVNFEDYAAFFTGCFHQIPVHINIARPSSNTMQIAYIINPDVAEQKMIVIANFIFGNSRELATAVTEIAKFHAETKKHKVA
uniref:Uncharacterized protein n=1 Tax=Romanomermis culicivorax TaxID=13658 RepID=A0A915HFR0_ROMCU